MKTEGPGYEHSNCPIDNDHSASPAVKGVSTALRQQTNASLRSLEGSCLVLASYEPGLEAHLVGETGQASAQAGAPTWPALWGGDVLTSPRRSPGSPPGGPRAAAGVAGLLSRPRCSPLGCPLTERPPRGKHINIQGKATQTKPHSRRPSKTERASRHTHHTHPDPGPHPSPRIRARQHFQSQTEWSSAHPRSSCLTLCLCSKAVPALGRGSRNRCPWGMQPQVQAVASFSPRGSAPGHTAWVLPPLPPSPRPRVPGLAQTHCLLCWVLVGCAWSTHMRVVALFTHASYIQEAWL